MKAIKIRGKDGDITTVNPIWVKTVRIVHPTGAHTEWTVVVNFTNPQNNDPIVKVFETEEKALETFNYINDCLNS